jgi:hypothetical protein
MNKDLIEAKSKFAIFFGFFSLGLMFIFDSVFNEFILIRCTVGIVSFIISIFLGIYFVKNL